MSDRTVPNPGILGNSVPKTYRINKDVLKEIDKRASQNGISSNQLVNNWLIKCMYLDPLWTNLDAMTIGRNTVSSIIKLANEDELEKVGSELGRIVAKQLFLIYNIEPNLASLIHAFHEVYSKNCNWFKFNHNTINDTHQLIFIHEVGINWSKFIKGYIEATLKTFLKIDITIELDKQMVKFTVKDRSDF